MQRPVNRVHPAGQRNDYVSWRILAPKATHHRPASCGEVDCSHHLNGWATILPAGDPRCDWIRHNANRVYTETPQPGGLTRFEFGAGQQCFAAHSVPLERDPMVRRDVGDWRHYSPGRSYDRADQWVDDFAAHTDKLKERI